MSKCCSWILASARKDGHLVLENMFFCLQFSNLLQVCHNGSSPSSNDGVLCGNSLWSECSDLERSWGSSLAFLFRDKETEVKKANVISLATHRTGA